MALARLWRQDLRWILVAVLFPFMALGLYGLAVHGLSASRYDPRYFTPEYQKEYATPGTVALALEAALQSGDRSALADLQGRRHPANLPTSPYITFVMLTNRTDRFFTYLYIDMRDYKPYEYHLEKVEGRYVVVPPDAYYYLYSGRWFRGFVPLAAGWWLLSLVGFLLVTVRRLSARLREQNYTG
jgi:hypothetical protein